MTVSDRQLNRWTLARQLLLERERLDAPAAISRLAGMQAQYSPSPYVGLWSRLQGFDRAHLEAALAQDRVLKATLMRGTLHLVAAGDFDRLRAATRNPFNAVARMSALGVDTAAVRRVILAAAAERALDRAEIGRLVREQLPPGSPVWGAWHAVAIAGDLINLADDARFGYFGGSRYRLGPVNGVDRAQGRRHLVQAYLAAFGPATRADLARWSGQPAGSLAEALRELDLVELRHEDGRLLLDLRLAPRPEGEREVPVRFLPKWDNLLLAYARRERVLPDAFRATVIRKNGDVLPTFLVDGRVAGTWTAPLRGPAVLTLTPLRRLRADERRQVASEGELLLAWLRPEAGRRELVWQTA